MIDYFTLQKIVEKDLPFVQQGILAITQRTIPLYSVCLAEPVYKEEWFIWRDGSRPDRKIEYLLIQGGEVFSPKVETQLLSKNQFWEIKGSTETLGDFIRSHHPPDYIIRKGYHFVDMGYYDDGHGGAEVPPPDKLEIVVIEYRND